MSNGLPIKPLEMCLMLGNHAYYTTQFHLVREPFWRSCDEEEADTQPAVGTLAVIPCILTSRVMRDPINARPSPIALGIVFEIGCWYSVLAAGRLHSYRCDGTTSVALH